jgi:hypothetical protein
MICSSSITNHPQQILAHLKMLLTHPIPKRTIPVTMHAAVNNTSSPSDGNKAGMTMYPNKGREPKVAKAPNITTPVIGCKTEGREMFEHESQYV